MLVRNTVQLLCSVDVRYKKQIQECLLFLLFYYTGIPSVVIQAIHDNSKYICKCSKSILLVKGGGLCETIRHSLFDIKGKTSSLSDRRVLLPEMYG